jgi:hypothetical protein
MKRIQLLIAFAVVIGATVALVPSATASGGPSKFKTKLFSLNEVPSVVTGATGTFEATINKAGDTITFTLTFEGLSANAAVAHIHIGEPFANGGVSAFLCGGGGQPACPTATSGTVTGTITAANVVGPAAQGVASGDIGPLIAAMRAGATYVNVHTANFPAGEDRGNLGHFNP